VTNALLQAIGSGLTALRIVPLRCRACRLRCCYTCGTQRPQVCRRDSRIGLSSRRTVVPCAAGISVAGASLMGISISFTPFVRRVGTRTCWRR
jgi:hypothetical protein